MLASRPRSASGVVSFQRVNRKMPLTASAAPAAASHASAGHTVVHSPNATIAAPQLVAAHITALPCRWTRPVHRLVRLAASAPTAGAAYNSPRTDAPPN